MPGTSEQRDVLVIGGGPAGLSAALVLGRARRSVTVVDGLGEEERALLAARDVTVLTGRAGDVVVADDRVRALRLTDGTEVPCGAVFVAPRLRPSTAPLAGLRPRTVECDMGTALETDAEGRTSVPGLWAAGNVVDLSCQVLGAAELGSRAAIGINGELVLADARAALEPAQRRQ